jgi:hypothetical protein
MYWKGEESYFYGSSLYVDRTFLKGIPRRRQIQRSGLDNRRLVFFRSDTLGRGLGDCFSVPFFSAIPKPNPDQQTEKRLSRSAAGPHLH